ncbi:ISAs1 family transposase [Micromonospora sp. LOL_024]|uniref:ISAs1 family transposase n=1 Tax=Micromonospora sp. LOL_024 TaxID=3345412 RepID=UPI003A87400F
MAAARPGLRCTCWPRWTTPSRSSWRRSTVDGKTNEISRFQPLLDGLDLARTVITADALHTQREHARWPVEDQHAGYVFVVKRHQPRLYRQVKALPWGKIPTLDATRERGHGRYDIRASQAVTCLGPLALDFPHAAHALRIRRRRHNPVTGRWSTVTVYAITSLTAAAASPADLADWLRGHWAIEVLHHIRDTTYREDTSRLPTGNAPRALATSATPQSASSASAAPPRSHQLSAETAETHTNHYKYSDSPRTDIPRPCERPVVAPRPRVGLGTVTPSRSCGHIGTAT